MSDFFIVSSPIYGYFRDYPTFLGEPEKADFEWQSRIRRVC